MIICLILLDFIIDIGAQLNQAMFAMNGSCGFNLKSEYLTMDAHATHVKLDLKVRERKKWRIFTFHSKSPSDHICSTITKISRDNGNVINQCHG